MPQAHGTVLARDPRRGRMPLLDDDDDGVVEGLGKRASSWGVTVDGERIGTIKREKYLRVDETDSGGVEIKLQFTARTGSARATKVLDRFKEFRWIQVLYTNDSIDTGRVRRYVDPEDEKSEATERPFYWTETEAAARKSGKDIYFYDKPSRFKADVTKSKPRIWWQAELALCGVKSDGTIQVVRVLKYGFDIVLQADGTKFPKLAVLRGETSVSAEYKKTLKAFLTVHGGGPAAFALDLSSALWEATSWQYEGTLGAPVALPTDGELSEAQARRKSWPVEVSGTRIGTIKRIEYTRRDEPTVGGVNIELKFTARSGDTKADAELAKFKDLRWVQVLYTNESLGKDGKLEGKVHRYVDPRKPDEARGAAIKPFYWTEAEARAERGPNGKDITFRDKPKRSKTRVSGSRERIWWQAEIALVGVRKSDGTLQVLRVLKYGFDIVHQSDGTAFPKLAVLRGAASASAEFNRALAAFLKENLGKTNALGLLDLKAVGWKEGWKVRRGGVELGRLHGTRYQLQQGASAGGVDVGLTFTARKDSPAAQSILDSFSALRWVQVVYTSDSVAKDGRYEGTVRRQVKRKDDAAGAGAEANAPFFHAAGVPDSRGDGTALSIADQPSRLHKLVTAERPRLWWIGELALVGVRSDGQFEPLAVVNYGFDLVYRAGKVVTRPAALRRRASASAPFRRALARFAINHGARAKAIGAGDEEVRSELDIEQLEEQSVHSYRDAA